MSRVRNCSQKEMAVASAAPRYPNPEPQEAVRARRLRGLVCQGKGGRRGGDWGDIGLSLPTIGCSREGSV